MSDEHTPAAAPDAAPASTRPGTADAQALRSPETGANPVATTDGSGGGDAPETYNAEQEDEESQAQSVAGEAYHRDALGLGDTVKVSTGDDFDDVQDLVDHMRQMDSSGLIDMGAFAGERNDDEEEGRYGPAAEEE